MCWIKRMHRARVTIRDIRRDYPEVTRPSRVRTTPLELKFMEIFWRLMECGSFLFDGLLDRSTFSKWKYKIYPIRASSLFSWSYYSQFLCLTIFLVCNIHRSNLDSLRCFFILQAPNQIKKSPGFPVPATTKHQCFIEKPFVTSTASFESATLANNTNLRSNSSPIAYPKNDETRATSWQKFSKAPSRIAKSASGKRSSICAIVGAGKKARIYTRNR